MFDLEQEPRIAWWFPLGCFAVAGLWYFLTAGQPNGVWHAYWWMTVPLGLVSFSVFLRERLSGSVGPEE